MLRRFACAVLLSTALLLAQNQPAIANYVRGDMSFLASDALGGRGSATHDEFVAATYVVSQFQSFGLQAVEVERAPLASGGTTYNAIGLLRGSDASLAQQTILLSAHLDHLGTRNTPTGEVIYHGADDDASGTTAVLELARALASLPTHPRRTILFVCFGSEETGGQGDQYFLAHSPIPLSSIVANLEFEMIGQPDRAIAPDQLWLTGWQRTPGSSSCQPRRAARRRPSSRPAVLSALGQFALARQGIIAQTVSSYGLGAHYHQPTDDLAHIDFDHLANAIESMIAPIRWLADTGWKPSWKPGGQP